MVLLKNCQMYMKNLHESIALRNYAAKKTGTYYRANLCMEMLKYDSLTEQPILKIQVALKVRKAGPSSIHLTGLFSH